MSKASDKKKANATNKAGAERFAGAIEASAERPPPMTQTRLDLPDEVTTFEEIELRIPLSDDEVSMLDRRSAEALADADEEQDRLDKYSKPIRDKIKGLRADASADAKDAKERSRLQLQRVRVVQSPNTATVRFYSPETGREVQLSRAMTPAEMARLSDGPMKPPDGEGFTVETAPDDADGGAEGGES